jgi:hypothetical protein
MIAHAHAICTEVDGALLAADRSANARDAVLLFGYVGSGKSINESGGKPPRAIHALELSRQARSACPPHVGPRLASYGRRFSAPSSVLQAKTLNPMLPISTA